VLPCSRGLESQVAANEQLSMALVNSMPLRPLPLAHGGHAAATAWSKR